MTVEYLTVEDLLALAEHLGALRVRDLGLLDAAAHRPASSAMGRDTYGCVHEKAAVLLESLTRSHPLVDGNKRLAWMSIFVFFGLNGLDLDAPEDDAYDLVVGVATGSVEYAEAADRLRSWTRQR